MQLLLEHFLQQADIYILFYELGLNILSSNGVLSYITPNKFYLADYGKNVRKYILNHSSIQGIVDVSMMNIFAEASVYPTIINLKKHINVDNIIDIYPKVTTQEELAQNKPLQIEQKEINNLESDYIVNLNIENR